jgi:DNA-directed RNA polymerase
MRLLDDSLYELQQQRERDSVAEGVARYKKLAQEAVDRGDGAALKPAERLLLGWVGGLVTAIREELRGVLAGESGMGRGVYGPVLGLIPPDKLAVITMHEAVGSCMNNPLGTRLPSVCERIGKTINAEYCLPKMREDEQLWDKLTHTDRKSIRPKAVLRLARKHTEEDWGRTITTHLGAILMHLLLKTAYLNGHPAFKTALVFRGKTRSFMMLSLTDAAKQFIDDGHTARQYMRPKLTPMIVPPLAWQNFDDGGYLTLKTRLVKHQAPYRREELRNTDLSRVLPGMNALQAMPWRVNQRIMGIVRELWDTGGNMLGIPRRYPLEKPPIPADWDSNLASKKAWKKNAAVIRRQNAMEYPDRTYFDAKLKCAIELGDSTFWFPHQMDNRGRCYPLPLYLNHHGDDVTRGLLECAEGKPVTERGMYWLKVHLANCYGADHCAFDQRVAWVHESTQQIEGWLSDPLENTGWMDADHPFQTLAAAYALADAMDGKPVHVLAQMDGTCNGLQHYAALARSDEEAAAVNLVESDQPADRYAPIAALVAQIVEQDAAKGNQWAYMLTGMVDRKLVKQTIMTTVYNVTKVGARRQLQGQLKKRGFEKSKLYDASKYLTNAVLRCMRSACPDTSAVMDWLTDCAKRITAAKKVVAWATPLGLPVEQPYKSFKKKQIRTLVQRMDLVSDDPDLPPKARKQVQAFPPNYIHSIDASHMLLSAHWAHQKGIRIAAVHDSFWTHPSDVDTLRDVLREGFFAIHSIDLLKNLAVQFRGQYPHVEIPDPPASGKFDIGGVLTSTYAFS